MSLACLSLFFANPNDSLKSILYYCLVVVIAIVLRVYTFFYDLLTFVFHDLLTFINFNVSYILLSLEVAKGRYLLKLSK